MKKRSLLPILLCALLLCLLSLVLSLLVGSTPISPIALFHALCGEEGYESVRTVLLYVRLPRTLGALIAGAGLALSGTLLQSVLSNPLAAPGTIGVNAGAGFACVLCLAFCPSPHLFMPLFAFIGATAALLLILPIARMAGKGGGSLILAGVAVSALFQSGISLANALDTDLLVSYTAFSIGGLSSLQTRTLIAPAAIIACCALLALLLSRRIGALSLGDECASSLGVRVSLLRTASLLLASLSAAAAVSFAGLLGFIGLIVPHLARLLAPSRSVFERVLLSLPIGASVLLLADVLSRILFAPSDIPVGIVTAFVGTPIFFLILIGKRKGGSIHD